jgi:hypothetical protein
MEIPNGSARYVTERLIWKKLRIFHFIDDDSPLYIQNYTSLAVRIKSCVISILWMLQTLIRRMWRKMLQALTRRIIRKKNEGWEELEVERHGVKTWTGPRYGHRVPPGGVVSSVQVCVQEKRDSTSHKCFRWETSECQLVVLQVCTRGTYSSGAKQQKAPR